MATDLPTDLEAVESDGRTLLFYLTPRGKIAYMQGPQKLETQDDDPYTSMSVQINDSDIWVNEKFRSLAAVAFVDTQGQKQIKIYYVAGGSPILTEICSTNGGPWYAGRLGDRSKYTLAPNSKLNAIVQESTKQLKVYFTKVEDSPALSMVFVQANEDARKANWVYATVTKDAIKW